MNLLADECVPSQDDCHFYLCQETKKNCGPNGYLIDYGYKFCHKYWVEQTQNYRPKTQVWIAKVRLCLQERLASMPSEASCRETSDEAFRQHVPCYIETGFCRLPVLERMKVIDTMKSSLFRPEILSAGLNVILNCSNGNKSLVDFEE